jgi:Domain of unknown function (DUF4112)
VTRISSEKGEHTRPHGVPGTRRGPTREASLPRTVHDDAPRDPRLASVRRIAHVLDEAFEIPGTGFRIGIDPLVGLFPGLGDLLPALAGAYAIWVAWTLGAPASLLVRMALNLGIDAAVGSVPLAGDLFDAGWKPNARNARLLEAWVANPGQARRASRLLVLALVALVLAAAIGVAVVAWAIVAWAVGVIRGGGG